MPKNMNSVRIKLPNPAARLESLGKVEAAPAADWTFNIASRAAEIAASRRPAPAPNRILQSYDKTPFVMSSDKMYLPTGKFKMTKKGLREETMVVTILRASAGKTKFNVVTRTDPAKIISMTREIARICGLAAAADFAQAAADQIAGAKIKPEIHRVTPDITATASGNDCKRGAHTPSRWECLNHAKEITGAVY